MSGVRCQVSHVMCHIYIFILFFYKVVGLVGGGLVEGLSSTGPTPSSFMNIKKTMQAPHMAVSEPKYKYTI